MKSWWKTLRKQIDRWLCKAGLHHWKVSRDLLPIDVFPIGKDYEAPTRTCADCGKHQSWLPGYGGSELGCWVDIYSTPSIAGLRKAGLHQE